MNAESIHMAMLDIDSYPNETGCVTFCETHVSRLYFVANHVYKVKKRVNFGFLDFTSLDQRHFYCREELRLNRRFCPDTYLEVVEIRQRGSRYHVGAKDGEIVDYAVLMNRLPQDRMLDVLIEAGDPSLFSSMEQLGHHIGRLHRSAEIRRHPDESSHLDLVQRNWDENLRQTAPFVGTTLTTRTQFLITSHVESFLARRAPLLKKREEGGYVIDGHGDLHAEHICLTEPIRIYDCIEFNERFRIDDRLADLAFLLMDLEHRNRWDLSKILLDAYLNEMGDDPDLSLLLPFYKTYRAWVRGKVLSFLTKDMAIAPRERDQAVRGAQAYFNLATGYLCPPSLILTCGLMGTGKTTIGSELAKTLGAPLLRSDELRKQLAGKPLTAKDRSAFGHGLYTTEQTEQTYRALVTAAESSLASGKTVIVDASFARHSNRERFRELARRAGTRFLISWMECDRETILRRLRQRREKANDASDGRPELLEPQAAGFELPDREPDVLRIDTSEDIAYNVSRILCELIDNYSDSAP